MTAQEAFSNWTVTILLRGAMGLGLVVVVAAIAGIVAMTLKKKRND